MLATAAGLEDLVACGLLSFDSVLWVDAATEETLGKLVPQLAALTELATELDQRLAGAGMGGLEGVVALYGRLKAVLDGIAAEDLERMAARIESLQRTLGEVERRLAALRELKVLLEPSEAPGRDEPEQP